MIGTQKTKTEVKAEWLAPDGREWGSKRYIRPTFVHVRLPNVLLPQLQHCVRTPVFRAVGTLLKNQPRYI